MSQLNFVDSETGEIYGTLERLDVADLSSCLFYTIDYRDEQYPEYVTLKEIIDMWLRGH